MSFTQQSAPQGELELQLWKRGAGPDSLGRVAALVRASQRYCSHGLQIGRPYVLLILTDIKRNTTFLTYRVSLLTDLSRFARGQKQRSRKANLAKSVEINSRLLAWTLP